MNPYREHAGPPTYVPRRMIVDSDLVRVLPPGYSFTTSCFVGRVGLVRFPSGHFHGLVYVSFGDRGGEFFWLDELVLVEDERSEDGT